MSNKKTIIEDLAALVAAGATVPDNVVPAPPPKKSKKPPTDKAVLKAALKENTELRSLLSWATVQAASWYGFMCPQFDKNGRKEYKKLLTKCQKATKLCNPPPES